MLAFGKTSVARVARMFCSCVQLSVKPAATATGRPCVPAFPSDSRARQLEDASTRRSTFCGLRGAFEQTLRF